MSFAHLHVHTEYSTLDGFGNTSSYAAKAKKQGYKYLACTDHGNIDGLISFKKSCDENGIIPISGCELYVIPEVADSGGKKSRKAGHLLVLIENRKGFKNLCKILSFANTQGFYYRPRVTFDYLLKNLNGLIVSTACPQSFIHLSGGGKLLEDIYDTVGRERLYFEVMPHDSALQRSHNQEVIKLSKNFNCEVIATNDCHYASPSDAVAQEVLLAIQRKATWNDEKRWKFDIRSLNLKSPGAMKNALVKANLSPKYMKPTLKIAEMCSGFSIKQRKVKLPNVGKKKDVELVIETICDSHSKRIFGMKLFDLPIEYVDRYKFEMKIISMKEFTPYFVIVWDFVSWCKKNGIFIGPGRGSVGCSLVAYLLNITVIDPIKWELPFERFITEDRIDYPDIDIDVEHSKIEMAIAYLESKYGADKVAAISTFNRMKSRAAVKNVARVFEVNEQETNNFTKTIDRDATDGLTLALEMPEGISYQEKYPKVIQLAKKLENQIRTRSKHAAGVVISPINISKTGRANIVVQNNISMLNWEKNDTEYMGFMKLDVLSLKMLSIIGMTLDLIKQNTDKTIEMDTLLLDDKGVLQEINDGHVTGLFQVTGYATKSLIAQMKITDFEDIVAVIALSRPGPLNSGMTDEYIRRKAGKDWERRHKIYENITSKTFGLLVYQEQIMAVIHKVAGLPYTTADRIRKVIGKKRDPKEFAKYEKQFISGCQKTKVFSRREAKEFWIGLQNWAKYGFNLAHSVEYAMIGYWTAWLKYYYPNEFVCSTLTFIAKEKKSEMIEEAYRLGLELILPMVRGKTDAVNWIAEGSKLYVPFSEVEGIGPVKAREAKKSARVATLFGINKSHDAGLAKVLESIDAYRSKEQTEITREIKSRFNFRIANNPKVAYPNLYKICPNIRLKHLDNLLEGEAKAMKEIVKPKKLLKEVNPIMSKRFLKLHNKKLFACKKCELREECRSPVAPTAGKYNIFIVAEAPGSNEDSYGIPLIGKSGVKVWKSLAKKKIKREDCFVTNINQCWPSQSRTPDFDEVDDCSHWLNRLLKKIKPIVILSFGNNALYYFTGKKSGITAMSGKTIWNEEYSAWVCFCVHPSSTFRNADNQRYFTEGISNFAKVIRSIK